MSKKSVGLAIFLGIFGFGGFYAAGFKKGLILFAAVAIVGALIANVISPDLVLIANIGSVYMSYKWAKEHNEALPMIGNGQA